MNVPQQTHVVVNGVPWVLFSAQYETPDCFATLAHSASPLGGTYEAHRKRCHFYAISFYQRRSRRTSEAKYHAEIVLQDLKATAKLTGQIVDCIS